MHLSLLVECFVPTMVIRVRDKDKPWFSDDCRLTFNIKHGTHRRWTRDRCRVNCDEFVHFQRRANAVYQEAMHKFSDRSRDVLMNAHCPHKWWSTLKSAVFGSRSDSSLPPLIGKGGGLACESVGKADMPSALLKESSPGIQTICHPLAISLPVSLSLPSGHGR